MVEKKTPKMEKNSKKSAMIANNSAKMEQSVLKQKLICIGNFPSKIVINKIKNNNTDFFNSIFVGKFTKDATVWDQSAINQNQIIDFKEDIDTHFWHQILPFLDKDKSFLEKIEKNYSNKNKGIIVLSSLWEGFGSGITPELISKFKNTSTNSIIFGILPSQIQPPDAHYNAYSSVGLCLSKNYTPVVLLSRDQLENYVGIDNNGLIIKDIQCINFLLDLIKSKDTFVQEISELTRAFGVKSYGILLTSGASMSLYGSLENIFNITLLRPLLRFKLSNSSIVYCLVRIPTRFKNKLSKNKIELALANWFRDKLDLKSILISDPMFIDSKEDRIDIALFLGDLDLPDVFSSTKKKIQQIKNKTIKKGSIKKKDWDTIAKELD